MVTYEITKPDEWIGHYFPFKEVAEAGLQPTDFLILDFFARKQEYHKHEIADSLYEVAIKITLDLISETLCIPKSTVKDSLKRSEAKEMIFRAKTGISALPKFVEMFYIFEDGKLKKKITGKVKKSADSAQKAPAKENSCAESAQDSGGIRTEHLIVYNKGINVSVAEDKSVFENENQAPQVNANPETRGSDDVPPLSVENTQSQGLKETEYKQALMTLLKKFAREYWDRPDIDTFLEYWWVEGKKFEIKKYGMKKTVPGLLELLKAHFEGDVGEMNKKKAGVAADHSEIEGLVEKTIEYCNKWWKDEWRPYPELINMRKSHEKEKAAIKKLLMRNKKKEVSLIMFVYWKEPMVMNQRMESDWVSIEGNFNNVLELALEMYNMKSSWNHPDWPKQ